MEDLNFIGFQAATAVDKNLGITILGLLIPFGDSAKLSDRAADFI